MREAPSIVLVGAGSAAFGLTVMHDIAREPALQGATVWLVDLDTDKADRMRRYGEALDTAAQRGLTFNVTGDRTEALPGADAVIVSCEVDRLNRWLADAAIPRKHGVAHLYGENAGPGGLAHALRTIPLVASIALDVEKLAPNALLLNLTNPEGRICTAFRRHLDQPIVGLCHEVAHSTARLAPHFGKKRTLRWRAAGLNHITWLLEVHDVDTGEDLTSELPDALRKVMDADPDQHRLVEYLYDHFDAIVATTDSHVGEYFRFSTEITTAPDVEKRQHDMRELMDGVINGVIDGTVDLGDFLRWENNDPIVPILRAAVTGDDVPISSAILPNHDLVPQLPADCAVEVTAVAKGAGIVGDRSDDLPDAIAGVLEMEVRIQQLVAEAALCGSRDAAMQALLIDPVVASIDKAEAILRDYEEVHADLWPALS